MSGWVIVQIFSKGWYVLLASIIALAAFVLTTWLGNLGLVWQITTSEWLSIVEKARILLALVGSIVTNFTPFSAFSAVATAILFGLNSAVAVYSFRELRASKSLGRTASSAAGIGGLLSGLFGIGCAACGTMLISPALAFLGAGTFVTLLPFGGQEFSALGVGLLIISLAIQLRAISQAAICPIIPNGNLTLKKFEG